MFQLLTALLVAFIIPAAVGAAQGEDATGIVERFHTALLSVMQDAKKLGYEGRYERLAPVLGEDYDLSGIARITVGRYWNSLDDEQKKSLVETFSALSIATYASQFDTYSRETFETVSEEQLPRGDAFVRTLFNDSEGDKIRFDYVLRRKAGRWRIINIIADGVSDLALKRAEYTSIIRRDGFDALIAKLKDKIVLYAKSANQ